MSSPEAGTEARAAAPAPPRFGVTIPFEGETLSEHRRLLAEIESAGFTDAWSAEGGGSDAFTPLAAAAAWSSTLRLGAGVVSSFTRGPALLAQSAAAMSELAPGRFVLGVGSSSDVIVHDWNGLAFEQPYRRARNVVRFLRAAFSGAKVTEDYDTFSVRNFRLGRPVETPPPIVVAALREQMLRLAGREGDGAMINFCSAEDAGRLAAIVRSENPAAEIVDRIIVCPCEDADAVRAHLKPLLASYTVVGVYRAFHEWLGRGDALAESWAAWEAGDRKAAVAHVPDHVVDELCVHGSPAECRKHLDRFLGQGVTTAVLALVSLDGDPAAAIRACSPNR